MNATTPDDQGTPAATPVTPVTPGYASGQLARAIRTLSGHPDPATRTRAAARMERWRRVLDGMADGTLAVGDRAPVAGYPAWATPAVVRGGFATGEMSAGGALTAEERATADRAGVPAERSALFRYHLTDTGLAELTGRLDSGAYRVSVPEEAALLTAAWLLRAGDDRAAMVLLEELRPFADRLRFTPEPGAAAQRTEPTEPPERVGEPATGRTTVPARTAATPRTAADAATTPVHRYSGDEARDRLEDRTTPPAVESMNEALAVWNPFGDRLLALWLEAVDAPGGGPGTPDPAVLATADWRMRAGSLLAEYHRLARRHPRCGKHRRPGENLWVLRTAVEELLDGAGPGAAPELSPRTAGRVRTAVAGMTAKRGRPATPAASADLRLTELRERQAADAARPTHAAVAQLVARRLSGLPDGQGLPAPDHFTGPVTAEEFRAGGPPEGTAVPEPVRDIVRDALSAPVAELVARGVVPSAEVLAELSPRLVAAVAATAYRDPGLAGLVAAGYRAFRDRRSLLLLNLASQVRFEELPWVRAVAGHREDASTAATGSARTALVHLGGVALQGFPGTIVPNPLVAELTALARRSGPALAKLPFTEELAADIYMGAFGAKFPRAVLSAAELLEGTLYDHYYGIGYGRLRERLADPLAEAPHPRTDGTPRRRPKRRRDGGPETAAKVFASLVKARARAAGAGGGRGGGVAANGMEIEQQQILTTHNLALLAGPVGAAPVTGWEDTAARAFDRTCALIGRLPGNRRPLPMVKDAAYAWRQALFFLSLCPEPAQRAFLAAAEERTGTQPPPTAARLAVLTAGLRLVLDGGRFEPDGTARKGTGRRFTGWSTSRHWMLAR